MQQIRKPRNPTQNGEFQIDGVPEGAYTVDVSAQGFRPLEQQVAVTADKAPVLHFQLEIAPLNSSVEVSGAGSRLNPQTSTVQTMVSTEDIAQTAGADQTNSLAMITDFTPGAYMVHDMLHMRGGHQVNWFFDGIPVVNTNIAANVAPLINPKNVEELEVERGGYSSEYGDRTYGFFNVVTPSGFERNNEAELIVGAGNFYSTDDQFNFGSHTQRFAYYASVDGNRSELGLGTPVSQVIHDQDSGVGGFLSLLFNPSAKDQLRWIASLREDRYQIPNGQDDQERRHSRRQPGKGLPGGLPLDSQLRRRRGVYALPLFPLQQRTVHRWAAGHPVHSRRQCPFELRGRTLRFAGAKKRHDARAGIEVWGQRDNAFFGLTANPGGSVLNQRETHWANSDALFLEDRYQAASWLTFDLGPPLDALLGAGE